MRLPCEVTIRRNISPKIVLSIISFQIRLLFFHGALILNCFENIPASYFYKGLLKVKVRSCRGPTVDQCVGNKSILKVVFPAHALYSKSSSAKYLFRPHSILEKTDRPVIIPNVFHGRKKFIQV